jgi:hypothetical protein
MATNGRRQPVSIYDLQREQMAAEVRKERAAAAINKERAAAVHAVHALPPTEARALARQVAVDRAIDVKEALKADLFASGAPSCDNHFEKSRPCPSTIHGVSDQYMILDSFERAEQSRAHLGEFVYNFMVQGVTRNQAIGVRDEIDTVIGAQVCSFYGPVPYADNFTHLHVMATNPAYEILGLTANEVLNNDDPPAIDSDTYTSIAAPNPVTHPASQLPYGGRITLQLKEAGAQSFSDAFNRRHHFEFDVAMAGQAYASDRTFKFTSLEGGSTDITEFPMAGDRCLYTPLNDGEYFLFTDPLKDIHGLTLAFFNPDQPVHFPPDIIWGVTASAVNIISEDGTTNHRLTFTFVEASDDSGNVRTIPLTNPFPLLRRGDRIFFRNFEAYHTTSGSTYDVLNSYVNRPAGHLVGHDGFAAADVSVRGAVRFQWTFRLTPDVGLNQLTPTVAANTFATRKRVDVLIAKNRMRIPMRLRRVVSRLTNYIAP